LVLNPSPFTTSAGGVTVRVKVTPKASSNRVDGVHAGADGSAILKVGVTAAPEGGKANAAVIKLLAREWRLPKSSISVSAGASDRRKALFIEGDPQQLVQHLNQWREING